jgi:hypothetical protein
MTVIVLSLASVLFFAAMVCLVFILSRHGRWSFHEIPKLAKKGDGFAQAYLWFVYVALGLGFCLFLAGLILKN